MPARTICKAGHAMTGDNVRMDRDHLVCRKCKAAQSKAWGDANREKVRLSQLRTLQKRKARKDVYMNLSQEATNKAVTRPILEKLFDTIRETGLMKSTFGVISETRMRAFWHFNPKVYAAMKKVRIQTKRTMVVTVSAPAVSLNNPARVERIMERINAAVPRHYQRDLRDDVVSDMTLAWIEGRLRADDIEKRARDFVNARFKSDHNKWGDISLDVPLSEDGTVTLGDILPEDRRLWSPA